MASQVAICNRALSKLGAQKITSIEDSNKAARTMKLLYETVLEAELSGHNWNFAKKRATLPSLAEAPAWGFSLQYQLPTDCLKVIQVNDIFVAPGLIDYRSSDDSPWSIEDGKILTDFPAPLKIKYVKNVTDAAMLTPLFVELLASKLAFEGCFDITQSNTRQQAAKDDYNTAIMRAANTNAIELPPQGLPDDSWVLGRL